MSTQVQDVIKDALVEIGVLAAGEALPPNDAVFGLTRFQNQIDAWAADELTLAYQTRFLYTITSGTNTFTIGTGATIATPRPTFLDGINYIIPASSPAIEVPMARMDEDAYRELSIKSLSSSLPTQWFYNPTTPNGTLFVWPTVSQNVQIAIYYPTPVGVPAALTTVVSGPAGYLEAFMYQLAIRLCTPFGKPVPALLPGMAAEAYARIKRVNTKPGLLAVDPALAPHPTGGYNIYSDQQAGYNR